MADKNFNLNINLTTGESRAEVDRLNDELKKLKQSITDNQQAASRGNTSMAQSFSSLLGPIAGVAAGFFAIKKVGDFFGDSIEKANEQEKSLLKLSQALRATGGYTQEAVDIFSAFADEMERATGIQGEAVLESIAMGKQMGASNEQARELTKAAANLAATFGGDLNSRTIELGKAMNGNIGRLGQLIPELKNLSKAQLDAGAAADIINQKFGGNAEAAANTFQGGLGRIGAAWDDLKKGIGGAIIKNEEAKQSLEDLAGAIDSLSSVTTAIAPGLISVLADIATGFKIAFFGRSNMPEEDMMSTQIDNTKRAIEELKDRINTLGEGGNILDKMFGGKDDLKQAKAELAQLEAELSIMEETSKRMSQNGPSKKKGDGKLCNNKPTGREVDTTDQQAELDNYNQMLIIQEQGQLALLQSQEAFKQQAGEFDQADYDAKLAKYQQEQSDVLAQQEAINQLIYDGEMNKAAIIQDSDVRLSAMAKASAQLELNNQKARLDSKKKFDDNYVKAEQMKQQMTGQLMQAGFGFAAALAKDGSKEQFLIQKAGAIAQAIVAMNTGAAQALALGPIVGPPLATQMYVLGGLNIATILATTIKGLNKGGIALGGKSGVDSIPAMLTPGERVLTTQQTRAFDDFVYNIDNYRLGDGAMLEAFNRFADSASLAPVIYLNGTKLNKETGFESGLRLTV